jgi:hypothetical protein
MRNSLGWVSTKYHSYDNATCIVTLILSKHFLFCFWNAIKSVFHNSIAMFFLYICMYVGKDPDEIKIYDMTWQMQWIPTRQFIFRQSNDQNRLRA